MISLDDAYDIAFKSIPSGVAWIENAYSGEKNWYFGVYSEFGVCVGNSPIAVDKTTGEISLPMPSVPYYVSGDDPSPAELDFEKATKVPIKSH